MTIYPNLKKIMTKTQSTDFFIACKESRIENNTNFYGCFYLGPFDESLSQTLANDLRRTLLSELTGLAITSIEIEGVLHKFSTLTGMKEPVLDLICNLQNIVLRKETISSTNMNYRATKKTYIGFLSVNGPRVIKAADLKLPAGLQCVDPNQYIATLAEDGFLNMKFNINEGKNYIKQKPYNLDVTTLKKRNILLQNFKNKIGLTALKNKQLMSTTMEGKPLLSNSDNLRFKKSFKRMLTSPNQSLKNKTSLGHDTVSNPIPLDAVFMPVTKINCIIEENNVYSDFSTDPSLEFSTHLVPSLTTQTNLRQESTHKFVNKANSLLQENNLFRSEKVYLPNIYIPEGEGDALSLKGVSPYSDFKTFLSTLNYNSLYQTSLFLNQSLGQNKLLPWQANTLFFDVTNFADSQSNDVNMNMDLAGDKTSVQKIHSTGISNTDAQLNKLSLTKIKTFLGSSDKLQNKTYQSFLQPKYASSNLRTLLTQRSLQKNQSVFMHSFLDDQAKHKELTSNTLRANKFQVMKTVVSIPPKTFKTNPINTFHNQSLTFEYAKNFKLKPLRKKSQLILEIWTNGSIHPRKALYQALIFLSNNFLKLQTVKMLGSMFKSDLAYGNLKHSITNNYTYYQTNNLSQQSKKTLFKKAEAAASKQALNFLKPSILNTNNLPGGTMDLYLQSSLNAPIGILKISLRSYTALKKAGITTLKDLIKYSKKDLFAIKNLGQKSVFEIEQNLALLGLTLVTD
jgi:DNA-directed RNA polymerase alpha subunit|uniref:DNA-directed RNA polymerase n=1 Tax=Chlamydomonas reinhardtii TaxID=3055 RepID=A0A218N9C3_CHLRE|nr:RNA polymerase alpha subunit [Chlamydomonas reinhardtii]ASF83369.1 RNA polymerase alpha subunit [Chlamydomonas reinhardtii]ASF83437.1 RNA polymerase alpha subunit [Chlamydomonas reinhardtii]ASF83502.1 RNA polymerase alpha subunit [Chlamydomonas reinhardtii]ASF83568.1 RNA polymerase alpha subunit [Chlamydomonas reinhardtii]